MSCQATQGLHVSKSRPRHWSKLRKSFNFSAICRQKKQTNKWVFCVCVSCIAEDTVLDKASTTFVSAAYFFQSAHRTHRCFLKVIRPIPAVVTRSMAAVTALCFSHHTQVACPFAVLHKFIRRNVWVSEQFRNWYD